MFNGFYSIFFTGQAGLGMGMITLHDGKITGADVMGATYSGNYQEAEDKSQAQANIKLTVPPGVTLVTGSEEAKEAYSIEFNAQMPRIECGKTSQIQVLLPTGAVNVNITKISELEAA